MIPTQYCGRKTVFVSCRCFKWSQTTGPSDCSQISSPVPSARTCTRHVPHTLNVCWHVDTTLKSRPRIFSCKGMPFMLVKKGKASIYVLFNDLLQVFVVIEQLFDDILRKKKKELQSNCSEFIASYRVFARMKFLQDNLSWLPEINRTFAISSGQFLMNHQLKLESQVNCC